MSKSIRVSLFGASATMTAVILFGGNVFAQIVPTPYSYGTTLDAGSPVFNRPVAALPGLPPTTISSSGTAVSYGALFFIPDTTGSYSIETTAATLTPGPADDTFLVLYQGSFNPASPLTNALAADDDSGVGSLSLFSQNLTAGTSYFLITTTFSNGVFGQITTRISGPPGSSLNLSAIPEPGSAAVLGLGALGLAFRRRKK